MIINNSLMMVGITEICQVHGVGYACGVVVISDEKELINPKEKTNYCPYVHVYVMLR